MRACLLMLVADAAPYSGPCGARHFFIGEHVEELLGGPRDAAQGFHEHQPRYGVNRY